MQISVIGPLEGADASGSVGAAVEGPAADDMADAIMGTRARQSDKSVEIRREISQQTGCGWAAPAGMATYACASCKCTDVWLLVECVDRERPICLLYSNVR